MESINFFSFLLLTFIAAYARVEGTTKFLLAHPFDNITVEAITGLGSFFFLFI